MVHSSLPWSYSAGRWGCLWLPAHPGPSWRRPAGPRSSTPTRASAGLQHEPGMMAATVRSQHWILFNTSCMCRTSEPVLQDDAGDSATLAKPGWKTCTSGCQELWLHLRRNTRTCRTHPAPSERKKPRRLPCCIWSCLMGVIRWDTRFKYGCQTLTVDSTRPPGRPPGGRQDDGLELQAGQQPVVDDLLPLLGDAQLELLGHQGLDGSQGGALGHGVRVRATQLNNHRPTTAGVSQSHRIGLRKAPVCLRKYLDVRLVLLVGHAVLRICTGTHNPDKPQTQHGDQNRQEIVHEGPGTSC